VLAVDRFLSQSNNQEFQRQYEYIAEFEQIEGSNNFLATFRLKRQFRDNSANQAAPSIDQISQQDHSKQRFRDTGVSQNTDKDKRQAAAQQETNEFRQRSTGVGTAAWKSQYAQQRERERSTEMNNNQYRQQFTRTNQSNENRRTLQTTSFDYQKQKGQSSPLREISPNYDQRDHELYEKKEFQQNFDKRMSLNNQNGSFRQTSNQAQFSLYEQHRQQREQREHKEYQRIQAEHQRDYEMGSASQALRERIMATYRAEIESHKLNERDFNNLKQQIAELRRRKEALDVSVTALQGDYEAQLKSQQNVIHSLENELDILQQQNQDKAEESVDIQEQIKAVRIEISAQESDIRDLDNDINGKVMHNQGIERENENIKYSITENQELRQR
jgi:hypothetical protein